MANYPPVILYLDLIIYVWWKRINREDKKSAKKNAKEND